MNSPPPWPPIEPGRHHPPMMPPHPPHPAHQDHRITVLEQTVIRLQELARWHIDSINQKTSMQAEEIKELRQEHKQLYTQALRIVAIAAMGAALVIFNVIWKNVTAGSSF